jgi:hypothetical protein
MPNRTHIAKPDHAGAGPLPFPARSAAAPRAMRLRDSTCASNDSPRDPAGEVLAAFSDVSRRIEDLARELKCFGYFDDGDDFPRAA